MAQSSKNCPACQAAVRPNAVFCHHCGRPLSIVKADATVTETQNLAAENVLVERDTVLEEEPPTIVSTVKPVETPEKSQNNNGRALESESTAAELTNPNSAAATKKKPGRAAVVVQPKQAVKSREYVWMEASVPAWRIILFPLLAFAAVALLLWLNNFLR